MTKISEARIAILATNGFEQSELEIPRDRLRAAGATVEVASPDGRSIRGWEESDWGREIAVDTHVADLDPACYDGLVLPGGQISPDLLRVDDTAIRVIRDFVTRGRILAAICHAPWLLIEAGALKGTRATSYKSIRTDMINAGAHWVDEPVVVSGNIITSRNPGDLEAFSDAIIAAVEKAER